MAIVSAEFTKLRARLNDLDVVTYMDDELLGYYNDANSFLRRVVAIYKPSLISDVITGETADGVAEIDLGYMPVKILTMWIGDNKIDTMDLSTVPHLTTKGIPLAYSRTFSRVRMYPVPDRVLPYNMLLIRPAAALVIDSIVPWPDEYLGFLLEYCCVRADLRNEFNMTQETQIMSLIHDQIVQLLSGTQPLTSLVHSYFDPIPSVRVRDY